MGVCVGLTIKEGAVLPFDMGYTPDGILGHLSLQGALDTLFKFYNPQTEVQHFTELLNAQLDGEEGENKDGRRIIKKTLGHVCTLLGGVYDNADYFDMEEIDEDLVIPVKIKTPAVEQLLLKLGRVRKITKENDWLFCIF